MCVLGVEGSEKNVAHPPLRIISGTALSSRNNVRFYDYHLDYK